MNRLQRSCQNYSEDILILGLPNEISLKCFSYLSSESAAIASRVCKTWHSVLREDMLTFKYRTITFHFQVFQDMTTLLTNPNREYTLYLEREMIRKIEAREIVDEFIPTREQFLSICKKKSSIGSKIKSSIKLFFTKNRKKLYVEMLKLMQQIALYNHYKLLLFEYPIENRDRFQECAIKHLPPLDNIIYTADWNIGQKFQSVSKDKIMKLFLSRSVCSNPQALVSLEGIIPYMINLRTVELTEISIVKRDDENPALEHLSKILKKIENLQFLIINKFQMNDIDAGSLSQLIRNLKKLTGCRLVDDNNMTDEGLAMIVNAIKEKIADSFFHFWFKHHNSPAIQKSLNSLRATAIDLNNLVLNNLDLIVRNELTARLEYRLVIEMIQNPEQA